jgi:hypothetical protein
MTLSSPKVSSALVLVAALCFSVVGQAQANVAGVSDTATAPAHDKFPDALISAHVRDGVLTIDGMVAKVQLNYEIDHMGYMYFFVPGVGTAVVSLEPLVGGVKIPEGFKDDKLAFEVDGHTVELASSTNLISKHKAKADIYVRMDHSTVAVSRYPRIGYGDTTQAPYMWPLSNPDLGSKEKVAYVVPPPATPKNLLPQTASNQKQ